MNSKDRNTKTLMKTFVSVLSFTHIERSKDSLINQVNSDEGVFSEERIEMFRSLANRRDCVDILLKSFAPSIFESDLVKFGLLSQLFGGTEKSSSDSSVNKRAEINILLLGDPSTGKSQLLK